MTDAALSGDKDAVDLGPLAQSLGFLLRLSQLTSFRDFFTTLGAENIRPGEASVLMLIARNPGIRQGVLAKELMIKRAHMTKMMRAMETSDLVTRTVPQDDRRAAQIWLTDCGRARVDALEAPFMAHESAAAPGLTRREEAELKRLLRKYLGIAEAEVS